jgi:site-specific recombinase XerD
MTDVDLNNGTLKVMGKGNKERYVPIGQATQKEIDTYVHFYRPKPAVPDIEELLLTEDGVPFTYSALATTMRRIREATGLKRLHMHKVRHTALTKMIENGVPAFAVQQFAGHSSIATTEGYVHLAQQRTANRFNSGSVVDKLPAIQQLNRRGRQRR